MLFVEWSGKFRSELIEVNCRVDIGLFDRVSFFQDYVTSLNPSDDVWLATSGGSCSKFEMSNSFVLASSACDGKHQFVCVKPGKDILMKLVMKQRTFPKLRVGKVSLVSSS